jgi:hypothetical protein
MQSHRVSDLIQNGTAKKETAIAVQQSLDGGVLLSSKYVAH